MYLRHVLRRGPLPPAAGRLPDPDQHRKVAVTLNDLIQVLSAYNVDKFSSPTNLFDMPKASSLNTLWYNSLAGRPEKENQPDQQLRHIQRLDTRVDLKKLRFCNSVLI